MIKIPFGKPKIGFLHQNLSSSGNRTRGLTLSTALFSAPGPGSGRRLPPESLLVQSRTAGSQFWTFSCNLCDFNKSSSSPPPSLPVSIRGVWEVRRVSVPQPAGCPGHGQAVPRQLLHLHGLSAPPAGHAVLRPRQLPAVRGLLHGEGERRSVVLC